MTLTWKFFSLQPFFARARKITSASTSVTTPSSHTCISSKAVNLVFQLASPRSVRIEDGISSAARMSASSDECLNLNVSRTAGAAGALAFPDFAVADTPGGSFFVAGAVAFPAAGAAFFVYTLKMRIYSQ